MMTKLGKLDDIQERMESMDNDLKSVKQSLELYVYNKLEATYKNYYIN